jgi:transcriptional regulator with XRE-family HTH domain
MPNGKLGEILRARREKKNITLEQAAADTRIREKFLKALEDGDYQSLPGAVYTKGFLRNYAEYLDLETDELIPLYQHERGQPEPSQTKTFKPYRPVVHRGLIFRPVVFVPVILLAGVGLFVGYLYYQFTTFATLPRLEVTDPASDEFASSGDLVVRGITVPDGRITVRVYPGPDTFGDIRPGRDGSFVTSVALKPGANHIEVEVLDAAGKTNRVSRTIQYAAPLASALPAQLVIEQPANGVTVTNTYVQVSGHTSGSLTTLSINNTPLALAADGKFATRYYLPAGQQTFTISARTPDGTVIQETRSVNIVYTQAVVTVFVNGGDAWILATIDGAPGNGSGGRTYHDGESAVFSGKQVILRTGNAAATQVIYNGQPITKLGSGGEVVERVFTVQ